MPFGRSATGRAGRRADTQARSLRAMTAEQSRQCPSGARRAGRKRSSNIRLAARMGSRGRNPPRRGAGRDRPPVREIGALDSNIAFRWDHRESSCHSKRKRESGVWAKPAGWPRSRVRRSGRKATARTTIACRKSEAEVSSPHEQFRASVWPRPPLPSRRHGVAMGKGGRKIFPAKTTRNPLISLDSDERIQGNPSFSNPQKRGFPTPKWRGAKKTQTPPPEQPRPPASRPPARKEANRLYPNAQRARPAPLGPQAARRADPRR